MSSLLIPADWKVKRSTPFFTKENVPAALLSHHNTAAGVFGQLCVMEGTVTYYGFANEQATEPGEKSRDSCRAVCYQSAAVLAPRRTQ
ncbi:tellurite resistance protein B [Klebsiella pneumoniae]|nr:tellurite resistance protein B [Klebsiella pneumoniae]